MRGRGGHRRPAALVAAGLFIASIAAIVVAVRLIHQRDSIAQDIRRSGIHLRAAVVGKQGCGRYGGCGLTLRIPQPSGSFDVSPPGEPLVEIGEPDIHVGVPHEYVDVWFDRSDPHRVVCVQDDRKGLLLTGPLPYRLQFFTDYWLVPGAAVILFLAAIAVARFFHIFRTRLGRELRALRSTGDRDTSSPPST